MDNLARIHRYATVTPAEEALLTDPAAPVVLLSKAGDPLPDAIAPGLAHLGVMLPYTPLHALLVTSWDGGPLVMTSANRSGEPQVIGNDAARHAMIDTADAYLMHDRDIVRRLDDGVERTSTHGPMVLRRARGRSPATLPMPPGFEEAPQVLAFGGQLKSTICLTKDGRALLSHHLGDLDDALTWDEYRTAEADYAALFDHAPEVFAVDLHPGYRATQHGAGRAGAAALLHVQHHHAHLAAVMGDAGWGLESGPVAGIILDGLGYGEDGTIWGGELLVGDYHGFHRAAHLATAPLPGGDAAQQEPWRNLLVRLDAAGLSDVADEILSAHPVGLLRQAVNAGVNAPQSSSAGRLFDAVAAALDLTPKHQSYEGEAAMLLEALAQAGAGPGYEFNTHSAGDGPVVLDPSPVFRAVVEDQRAGRKTADSAYRFHAGLADAFAGQARRLVESGDAQAVALSGGCFQNVLLLEMTVRALGDVPVLLHRDMPANDGGLAFGQALVAAARSMRPLS